MSIDIKVESNLNLVQEELERAKEAVLEAIGQYVQSEAKVRTPVGQYTDGRVGGRLRSSIDYKVESDKDTVHIGTNVEYAPYVEFGTSKMKAQPYLTPAIEENMSNIKRVAESTFGQFGG